MTTRHQRLLIEAAAAAPADQIILTGDTAIILADPAMRLVITPAKRDGTWLNAWEAVWGSSWKLRLDPTVPASIAHAAVREAVRLILAGKIGSPERVACPHCDRALLGPSEDDNGCPRCGWTGVCQYCAEPLDPDSDNPQYHDGACSAEARAEADGEAQIAAYQDAQIGGW